MKIAIHQNEHPSSFVDGWIEYCENNSLEYKLVNCFSNHILDQIKGCDILMWHILHYEYRDLVFAKQMSYAIAQCGINIFPNFDTLWHFDDKLAQKYLFEAINIDTPKTWIFFSFEDAVAWINTTNFPVVAKLRAGAGSSNVILLRDMQSAHRYAKKIFRKGFPIYNKWEHLRESIHKFRQGKVSLVHVLKAVARVAVTNEYVRKMKKEYGYLYCQEYIPTDHDIRVIIIDNKAFAIQRMVRKNDFRASGSGNIRYERSLFPEDLISKAFELKYILKTDSVAFDFISLPNQSSTYKLVEISYAFSIEGYKPCQGFWDEKIIWHAHKVDPAGWMLEAMIKKVNK